MTQRLRHRLARASAVLLIAAAPLALVACGSGSTSSTGSTASAATPSTSRTSSTPTGRASIVDCLTKAGITPPARPSGGGSGAPRGSGSASRNPKVTAALQKCGITGASRLASRTPQSG
jgi:hypothetical protein